MVQKQNSEERFVLEERIQDLEERLQRMERVLLLTQYRMARSRRGRSPSREGPLGWFRSFRLFRWRTAQGPSA